jgi:hypothetical protein
MEMAFTKEKMVVYKSTDLSDWSEHTNTNFYLNGSQASEEWLAFEVRGVSDVLALEINLSIYNWIWNANVGRLQADTIIYFCRISDMPANGDFPMVIDKAIPITFSEDSYFSKEYEAGSEHMQTYKTINIPINTSGYNTGDPAVFDGDKFRFMIYANKICEGAGYSIDMYVNGIKMAAE